MFSWDRIFEDLLIDYLSRYFRYLRQHQAVWIDKSYFSQASVHFQNSLKDTFYI